MTVRDMILVNIFLSVCHAVVEDTALFLALGANPLVIIPGRLAAALLITYLVSRSIFIRRCGESPKAGGIMPGAGCLRPGPHRAAVKNHGRPAVGAVKIFFFLLA